MQQDKSHWKCIQLPDKSVYYGEVAFISDNGDILESEQPGSRQVRHGQGVQIFGTNADQVLCKYEGQWHSDKKHGQGTCVFPNGAIYFGALQWDKRQGYGKYTWPDGKTYEGEWKDGRMEGSGVFRGQQIVLRGNFRGNYYVQGDLLVNPLVNEAEYDQEIALLEKYKKKRKQEEERKDKQVKLHRIPNLNQLNEALEQVDKSGRIAIIQTTQQSLSRKEDLIEKLRQIRPNVNEIDLRYMPKLKEEEGRDAMRRFVRENVKNSLINGDILLLNLDDSQQVSSYEELFDPDLQEIIHYSCFPYQLFQPLHFKKKFEIWKNFRKDEEVPLNKDYLFVIWSKTRFDENLDDQDVLMKFEKRFSRTLDLQFVDCVLFQSQIDEEELQSENASANEEQS